MLTKDLAVASKIILLAILLNFRQPKSNIQIYLILHQAGYFYELNGVGSAGENELWIRLLPYNCKWDFDLIKFFAAGSNLD